MKDHELRFSDTNSADDSEGKTWGLDGNLFWFIVAGVFLFVVTLLLLFSALRCTLHTGRTHQIRIHAEAGLRHPLLGDPVYGNGVGAPRTMLHALALSAPREGKPPITARAPLPADFIALGFSDADLGA